MKAVVFTEPNKLEVREAPDPQIGPDEVLVQPKRCGICGSDYDLLEGEYILPISYPVIPGHEWSGVVVEAGKQVKDFRTGDRVVGECAVGCGACKLCKSGYVNCCPVGDHFGFTLDGAMAEFVKVKAAWLHKLPHNLSLKEGALIEPFTVGYYSICAIGRVDGGDTVLVSGGGTIGLSALIAAKGMGARVILAEPLSNRRNLAKELGAEAVVDPYQEDFVEKVKDLTRGEGADVVIEAAGVDDSLKTVLDLAGYAARVSFVGINLKETLPVGLGKIQKKGLNVKGIVGSPYVWEKALKFLSQVKPNLSLVNTHEFTIDEAKQAFGLARKADQCVKVQLVLS